MLNLDPERLAALAAELREGGPRADAWLGGLQLVPRNADRYVRLELGALAVAASESGPLGEPDRNSLERRLNDGSLSDPDLAAAELDYDNPFTESFTFWGGPYVVFPGPQWEVSFELDQLLRTVFTRPSLLPDAETLKLRNTVALGLRLSSVVAFAAGVERNQRVAHRKDDPGEIFVPDADTLRSLMSAVTLDAVRQATVSGKLPPELLDEYVRIGGDGTLPTDEDSLERLRLRPLVRRGDDLIVALPHALLGAALDRGLRLCLANADGEALAARIRARLAGLARRRLEDAMGADLEPVELPPPSTAIHESIHRIDVDKLMHVSIASDDFVDWDGFAGSGWRIDALTRQLQARDEEVESFLKKQPFPPSEVLHLRLAQPIGRLEVVPDPSTSATTLTMTVGELLAITRLEDVDGLALRQYARARSGAHEKAIVLANSELAEFRFYRLHKDSYYAADRKIERVVVAVGNAGVLRSDGLVRRDPHSVTAGRQIYEVERYFPDSQIPIYFAPGALRLLVEDLPLQMWVIPEPIPPGYGGLYRDVSTTIAYWIWQLGPGLEILLRSLSGRGIANLDVCVQIEPSPAWSSVDAEASGALVCSVDDSRLLLNVPSSLRDMLANEDNRGEREILRVMLRALAELATDEDLAPVGIADEIQRDALLDRYAPLGPKRHLLLEKKPADLGEGKLPALREIQQAEIAVVLDEIGPRVVDRLALKPGPIADGRRGATFNTAVQLLFEVFTAEVGALSSDGLLEHLIEHHERVSFEQQQAAYRLPSRIACFGERAQVVEEMREHLPKNSTRAVAGRFLIEYVAAQPPKGDCAFSVTVLDRLLAVAGEIANLGFGSDAVHYGVSDPEMAVLDSGRIAWATNDPYGTAMTQYLGAAAEEEIAEGVESNGGGTHSAWDPFAEFDVALQAEWGFSLTDVLSFFDAARALGLRLPVEAKRVPIEQFIEFVADLLEWAPERVRAAIDLFALRERSAFLPEPPVAKAETFPWRYGRDLSYLRRPFLLRQMAGGLTEILWGNRQLHDNAIYILTLLRDGRIDAKTKLLQDARGRRRTAAGKAFASRVAALFKGRPDLLVRTDVRKIGSQRLRDNSGADLGDIDVFVADLKARSLLLIEAKNLALARTPAELHNQLEETFVGSGGVRSHAEIHMERSDWVRKHLGASLAWFGVPMANSLEWSVQSLIVLSRPQPSPYVSGLPLPVVSYRQLRDQLAEED